MLASKTKSAAELKKKLGITGFNQWTSDLGAGFKNLQETTAYVQNDCFNGAKSKLSVAIEHTNTNRLVICLCTTVGVLR